MKVALWAEIRRLSEIEKRSGWAIARRLHCSRHTHANTPHAQTPRTDRRHRTRTCRSRALRPLLSRQYGGFPWHDLTTLRQHNWIAISPN
jgi:hypothetical protein